MQRKIMFATVAFAALLLHPKINLSPANAANTDVATILPSITTRPAGQQLADNMGGGNGGDDNGGGDDRCMDQAGWKWGDDGHHDCDERECEPDDVSTHKCKHDPDDECCEPNHHHHHHGKDGHGMDHDWWT